MTAWVAGGQPLNYRGSVLSWVTRVRIVKPVTPGELLAEEFLKPMRISRARLVKESGIGGRALAEVLAGKCPVTKDVDMRLCRYFGLSKGYWLRAQASHDRLLEWRTLEAKRKAKTGRAGAGSRGARTR